MALGPAWRLCQGGSLEARCPRSRSIGLSALYWPELKLACACACSVLVRVLVLLLSHERDKGGRAESSIV